MKEVVTMKRSTPPKVNHYSHSLKREGPAYFTHGLTTDVRVFQTQAAKKGERSKIIHESGPDISRSLYPTEIHK